MKTLFFILSHIFFSHATCQNLIGSFECLCQAGYVLTDDNINCIDIDECSAPILNHCNVDFIQGMTCLNQPGSYTCTCISGYIHDPVENSCLDIDECQPTDEIMTSGSIANICPDPTMTCQNFPGFYVCDCQPGFQETNGRCQDIDECQHELHNCDLGIQNCVNLEGSYRCESIDFCAEITCLDPNSKCVNFETEGICECDVGYFPGRRTHVCVDIDECLFVSSCVFDNSNCINTLGSFICECQDGFELVNNQTCQSINPCQNGKCVSNDCVLETNFLRVKERSFQYTFHNDFCRPDERCYFDGKAAICRKKARELRVIWMAFDGHKGDF